MTDFFEFALGGTAWGGFWRFVGVAMLVYMPLETIRQIGLAAFAALSRRREEG